MILSIEEIEFKLNEKFSPFMSDMDDLILFKRTESIKDVEVIERKLEVVFPAEFLSFITIYNVSKFSLGPVSFGYSDEYLYFLFEANKNDVFDRWWIGNERPKGILYFAGSDPYSFLLNTIDGCVYSMTSESSMDDFKLIARSFDLFIRGVGTAFLKEGTAHEIEKEVGSMDEHFWKEIMY